MTENITLLSNNIRELIAVGASVAGNCLPCLRYHFAEAIKAGCSVEEIDEAIRLAQMVKNRPIQDINQLAADLLNHARKRDSLNTTPTAT